MGCLCKNVFLHRELNSIFIQILQKKKCIVLITNMRPLSRGFEAKYEESNRLIDLFSLYVLFSQFRPRDCQLYARGCTSIGHLKETVL